MTDILTNHFYTPVIQTITGVFILSGNDSTRLKSIIRNSGINTEELSTKRVAETIYFCIKEINK